MSGDESPSTIVLLAPTRAEMAPVLRHLNIDVKHPRGEHQLGNLRIVHATSGVGPQRAAAATKRELSRGNISRLILFGVAGGLDPQLNVSDLVEPTRVIDGLGKAFDLRDRWPRLIENTANVSPRSVLLTSDAIIESPRDKHQLHRDHGAGAVDMEAFTVAQVAAEHQVPLTVVRVISDSANMAMPAEAARWVAPDGRLNRLALTRHVLRHPLHLWRLIVLARYFNTSMQAVAERIGVLLQEHDSADQSLLAGN